MDSQRNNTRSLAPRVSSSTCPEDQIQLLRETAWEHRHDDPHEGVAKARASVKLARRELPEGDTKSRILATSLATQGALELALGCVTDSLEHSQESLSLARRVEERRAERMAQRTLASCYTAIGDVPSALSLLSEAVESCRSSGDRDELPSLLSSLAHAHRAAGDYAAELDVTTQALRIYENSGSRVQEAAVLNDAALAHHRLGDLDAARRAALRGLSIAQECGSQDLTANAACTVAEIHIDLDEHEQALPYLQTSLELCERTGDRGLRVQVLLDTARSLAALDAAADVLPLLLCALVTADELGLRPEQIQCHDELASLHERAGDLEAAVRHLRISSSLTRGLVTGESGERLARLRDLREVARAEREAQSQRRKALRMETLYLETDAFLSRVVDNISDALMIDDLNGRIVFTNDRFEEVFGLPPSNSIGVDFSRFVAPDWRERVRECHTQRISGNATPSCYEFEGLRTDGTRLWIEASVVVLNRGSEVIGTQSLLRDVTRRKTLELELRQAQKMEAIGKLAGGIAHDFNNLLTAIGGYAQLALLKLDAEHPQRRRIEEIVKGVKRAAGLTNQLLVFSRKQDLTLAALNLSDVVTGMVPMLRRLIGEDIRLTSMLDPSLRLVLADEGKLEQVLLNLVVNARDAMPSGGLITLTTENVSVGDAAALCLPDMAPGPLVKLTVFDTGCGMDEQTISQIFEPFFTTKARDAGTGLGLATVYGIVRQSGGVITVHSVPGDGTRFDAYFTTCGAAAAPDQSDDDTSTQTQRGTELILLVEDEPAVRELTTELLEESGYSVLAAPSVETAIGLVTKHGDEIDLLLTDVILPDGNGVELAEQLTAQRPDLPVVLVSGYSQEAIRRRGLRAERFPLLSKPFTPAGLCDQIRVALA